MSEAITFDTHRFVKNLTASGFTEAQAEALADEQANLLNSNLATKTDILTVKSDIREVKAELELKIEKARVGLSGWMLTGWVAQTGVLVTLYLYLFSSLPRG